MAGFNLEDYVQVNERIEKFYSRFPGGSIQTEMVSLDDKQVIFKAFAFRNPEDVRPSTGYAMEREGSSYINKTSHIENCETSAVGRALAMLGFEIKKSIASREEVANAKLNQDKIQTKPPIEFKKVVSTPADVKKVTQKADYARITDAQRKRLFVIQKEFGVSEAELKKKIFEFGYATTIDISKHDYEAICDWVEGKTATIPETPSQVDTSDLPWKNTSSK